MSSISTRLVRQTGRDVERNFSLLSYKGPGQTNVKPQAYEFLKLCGVARLFLSDNFEPPKDTIPTFRIPAAHQLPPGPSFISRSKGKQVLKVHYVYRLYLDEYDAFLFGYN